MRIGIDFDNTIVSYDVLFHKVAVERGVVPPSVPQTKLAVRDYLRNIGEEDAWTEMQGYVYGKRMNDAATYPGVSEFLRWARTNDIQISVISHKTRYPFLGPQYDLHRAAREWAELRFADDEGWLIEPQRVFFELTQEAKLERITAARCDYFIDDLPEILLASGFPSNTARILFDPERSHSSVGGLVRLASWDEIQRYFECQCRPNL